MASLRVSAGAIHQEIGSHELLQFLLLIGGQEIDANLTALSMNLASKLRGLWRIEAPALSDVDPMQALSSFGREIGPPLADALPVAIGACRRLLASDENVSPFVDYFPNLLDELEDLEHLLTNLLRLSRTVRLEMDLSP
jgi:hypothetical protein